MIVWIRDLLPVHEYAAVVAMLNDEGFRTAKGLTFDIYSVGYLALKHGWGVIGGEAPGEQWVIIVLHDMEILNPSNRRFARWTGSYNSGGCRRSEAGTRSAVRVVDPNSYTTGTADSTPGRTRSRRVRVTPRSADRAGRWPDLVRLSPRRAVSAWVPGPAVCRGPRGTVSDIARPLQTCTDSGTSVILLRSRK